jgi:small conductance mechanosensitive channel
MDPEAVWSLVVQYGVNVVGALLLVIVAWIAGGILGRWAARAMDRAGVDATLARFLTKLVRWLIILLAVISCLGVFGVETTSFAAVIGAAGLAVGLAFQGTLSNFASGVMLLVFRPFEVGDVVTVAGQLGKVDAIDLFTTTLDTFDNRRFIIPNSSIFGSVIENISHHPIRRVDVNVGVGYGADVDRTREVLTAAIASVPEGLQEPEPAVVLLELGASSVDWSARVWAGAADFGTVKQALIRAVKQQLDEAGIEIPYPQMDVHLDQPAAG